MLTLIAPKMLHWIIFRWACFSGGFRGRGDSWGSMESPFSPGTSTKKY